MKESRNRTEHGLLLANSVPSDTGGLLKTGIFSVFLHIALVIFLIFNLKSPILKSRSNVYWVTIRPGLSISLPPLEKAQVKRAVNKLTPEARPIVDEKNQEQMVPLPVQPVIARVPEEDQKPLLQPEKKREEEGVEPIPLPMAEVWTLSAESKRKTADDPIISSGSSILGDQHMNFLSNAVSVEGSGTGPGGAGEGIGLRRGAGLDEGAEIGQGGSGLRVGYGTGPGGSNRGGSRDGAGGRQGGSGGWVGDGLGPGQGGVGNGIAGKGGAGGVLPRYARNPKPVYPQVAREKGYEGEVLLRVEVLSNGGAGQIEVKRTSGYDVLDQSALMTVKQWKFIPARRGDVPVTFWINIPIKFQLL